MLLQEQNAGFQVCPVFKIKETRCLFLVIDSTSISVIILYWPVRKNCWDGGRGGGIYHFHPYTVTFYVSGGGEAEEPHCSLNL